MKLKTFIVATAVTLAVPAGAAGAVPTGAAPRQQQIIDRDPYGVAFRLAGAQVTGTALVTTIALTADVTLTKASVAWAGDPSLAPKLTITPDSERSGVVVAKVPCGVRPYEGVIDVTTSPGGTYTIPVAFGGCANPTATTINPVPVPPAAPLVVDGSAPLPPTRAAAGDPMVAKQGSGDVGVAGTVTITGTVKTSAQVAMSNVWIRIYDEDITTQDEYGSALTNASGFFSISVPCETDVFNNHIDPRIKVQLENTAWRIEGTNGNPYEKWVNMGDDVACTTLNAGTITPTGANDEIGWMRWEWVEASWNLAQSYVSIAAQAKVRIPEASTTTGFYRPWEDRLYLGQTSTDETLHHEYGHYVHDMALGNSSSLPGPGGAHSGCQDGAQDQGLALTEGWASFWSSLLSTRYLPGCPSPQGQSNENDVFQIFYDMCDNVAGRCNVENGLPETWDWVTDSSAISHSITALSANPSKLGDMKWNLGVSRPREFTVASKQNGYDHDVAPTITGFTSPAANTWLGSTFTMGASVNDTDTYNDQVTFSLQRGGTCSGSRVVDSRGSWSYSTSYTAPSGIEDKFARVCATPQDELEKNGSQSVSSYTIWIDTKPPTSTASVNHPPLSTSWTVSFNASDGGSGVNWVWVYEQDPYETSWALEYQGPASSGSFPETAEIGNLPGTYCYKTIARDNLGNVEPDGPAESCSGIA